MDGVQTHGRPGPSQGSRRGAGSEARPAARRGRGARKQPEVARRTAAVALGRLSPRDLRAPKATQFKPASLHIHSFHLLHPKKEFITTISNSQDENALPSAKQGLLPDLLLVVLRGSWPGEATSLPQRSWGGGRWGHVCVAPQVHRKRSGTRLREPEATAAGSELGGLAPTTASAPDELWTSRPAWISQAASIRGPPSNSAGACGLRLWPALTSLPWDGVEPHAPSPEVRMRAENPPKSAHVKEGATVAMQFGAGGDPTSRVPFLSERLVPSEALAPHRREAPGLQHLGGPPRVFRTGEHKLRGAGVRTKRGEAARAPRQGFSSKDGSDGPLANTDPRADVV